MQVEVTSGTTLVGFGKGRFRAWKKEGGEYPEQYGPSEKEIEFIVSDPNTLCVLDGVITTYGNALDSKRKSTPDKAFLTYHKSTHDLATGWRIAQDFSVFWVRMDFALLRHESTWSSLICPFLHSMV
jgi:hypothetical protein